MKQPVTRSWVAVAALCASAAPASAAPPAIAVGPFKTTDTPVSQPAANAQDLPAIIHGPPGEALAVWEDPRFGTTAIIAARIDLNGGTLIDLRGFVVDRNGVDPAVGYDGTNYVVAYTGGATGTDLLARRINATTGSIVDSTPLAIAGGSGYQDAASVACAGSTCLLAWETDAVGPTRVNARRLAADGTLGTTFDVSTADPTKSSLRPSVGATGSSFLVAWDENRPATTRDVYARVVDSAGTPGTEVAVLASVNYDETAPSVAWNGTNFLVAFETTTLSQGKDILGRRISAAGAAVGIQFAITSATGDQIEPAATAFTSGSADYYVAFQDGTGNGDVRGGRVSSAGAALDALTGVAIAVGPASAEHSAAVTPGAAGEFAVIYTENASVTVSNDIWIKSVQDSNGSLGSLVTPVSFSVNRENGATVGRGANGYFLAWEDNRDSSLGDLFGMRVGPDGTPIDATPTQIATAGVNGLIGAQVVRVGSSYEILWRSGYDLYWRRVGEADGILSAGPFSATTETGGSVFMRAASNGTDVLVAYMFFEPMGISTEVHTILLSNGSAPGTPVEIASYGAHGTPVATSSGWLLPWTDEDSINLTRLAADGSIVDVSPIEVSSDIGGSYAVGVSGTTAIVAWTSVDKIVHVRRVDLATGTVAAGELVLGSAPSIVRSVTMTGNTALVVWDCGNAGAADILGTRIDAPSLTRIDATDVGIVADASEDGGSSIAIDGAGNGMIAWNRVDTDPTAVALRARYATLGNLAVAAEPDAGVTTMPDAGVTPDAPGPADNGDGGAGCGCESSRPTPGSLILVGVAGLVLMRRRRATSGTRR